MRNGSINLYTHLVRIVLMTYNQVYRCHQGNHQIGGQQGVSASKA